MPRGDGTGPMGMGAMTGRGAGYCTGNETPKFARGMGGGRGFRRMFFSFDEKSVLKNQEKFLETQLNQVKDLLKGFNQEK